MTLYACLQESIDDLDHEVSQQVHQHPQARRLMTHPGVGPITALATEVFLGDPMRFTSWNSTIVESPAYCKPRKRVAPGATLRGNPYQPDVLQRQLERSEETRK
jgi:hypothetical protein